MYMMHSKNNFLLSALSVFFIISPTVAYTLEHKLNGIVELTYSAVDSSVSYLNGGYGKLRTDDGNQLSLFQGGLSYSASWESQYSFHLVSNAYLDSVEDNIGITESYVQYKSLPFENGYRASVKAGFLYPKISFENIATAWASPYTLNYSAINAWVGEELRHHGLDISVTRLGKFHGQDYDLEFSLSAYQENDTAGTVLAWHGWTMSSRQSLRQDALPLPNTHLYFVPDESDAFTEIDGKTGFHGTFQWSWLNRAKVLLGYYDNRGVPYLVRDLQYAWRTRFSHAAIKWNFDGGLELIAQHLQGDTLMQNAPNDPTVVVDTDYSSSFLLLSKKWDKKHRLTTRLEHFSVTDNDGMAYDDNNEDGKAATINYSYRFNKNIFVTAEYTWLMSDRPSRSDQSLAEELIERQLQLSARYFF